MDCRLYKEEHSLKKQTGNHILKMIAEHMEIFTCMMRSEECVLLRGSAIADSESQWACVRLQSTTLL